MSLIRPEQCLKCRFALPHAQHKHLFNCRRNPPALLIVPAVDPRTGALTGATQEFSAWPLVQPEHWCGEFRPHIQMAN